ncbi:MAG: hypothetical protein ACR2RF_32185 [Geminicoccaceae bacterium]
MTQATAMYGMDAYWAMRTNEAMGQFADLLSQMDPEVRCWLEGRLRRKYGAEEAYRQSITQSLLAQRPENPFERQKQEAAASGLRSILGAAGI